MDRRRILTVIVFALIGTPLFAQFRFPSLEVQVKGGITGREFGMEKYKSEYLYFEYMAPTLFTEVNWNINQYFSLGLFLVKGIEGENIQLTDHWYDPIPVKIKSAHQEYGINFRASLGRLPRFRPFIEASFGKFEMYIEQDDYRTVNSTTFIGASLGLMIKLSNRLYVVLPQFNVRMRSEPFYFESDNPVFLEAACGLSYSFGKRK